MTDFEINNETATRIAAVKGAEHFGISTAAFIDGEFVLVSDYDVPADYEEALKAA